MTGRVLMFPWQVGAGHTGRCLHLAARLTRAGYRVSLAADPTGRMARDAGVPTLGPAPAPRRPMARNSSGYLTVAGPGDAFAAAGYYHPEVVRRQVERDRAVIAGHRPDLVVTHMDPTCVLAAAAEGVPVLSVADADFLVTGSAPWMPWLGPGARPSRFPDPLPAFRAEQRRLGLDQAEEVGDLLVGAATLIASVPELERPDPRYDDLPGLHYAGPMVWDPDREGLLARRLRDFGRGAPLRVYASVGGGQVAADLLGAGVAEAARRRGWALLHSGGLNSGGPADGGAGQDRYAASSLIMRQGFGGINAACAWADVVVCHGGHSTVLAALAAGKPVVVAPAMSENEANGRQLVQERGAGLVLAATSIGPDDRLLLAPRGGAPRPVAEGLARAFAPEAFAAAVEEVGADPGYRARARELGRALGRAEQDAEPLLARVLAGLPAARTATARTATAVPAGPG
ncbi:glycosyltransferase [Streptacidiphilus cavernicola]|uniref:Glycosyltransferase n=1 Tax=Streptacidiphilus cavernicola TaxID=3342716 RepID=A0ABV6VSX7_9ACTN